MNLIILGGGFVEWFAFCFEITFFLFKTRSVSSCTACRPIARPSQSPRFWPFTTTWSELGGILRLRSTSYRFPLLMQREWMLKARIWCRITTCGSSESFFLPFGPFLMADHPIAWFWPFTTTWSELVRFAASFNFLSLRIVNATWINA